MRVLIIHNQLWAHYKARLFSKLAKHAKGFGIDLLVVQLSVAERSRAHLGMPAASEHQYPYELLSTKALEDISLGEKISKLYGILARFRPHIVNITGYYDPAMWPVMAYCKALGIKLVLSNESTQQDHQRVAWKEFLKRMIIGRFDAFFCFGSPSAQYLESLGASSASIKVKKAAVVDDVRIRQVWAQHYAERQQLQASYQVPARNFIYTGRFIEPKNLLLLLKAFAQAKALQPNAAWGLILLGDGVQKPALEEFVRAQQLSDVYFLPGTEWYEVPKYLALADVYVLPSTSEPWGLVVNEAMVCHMPVLVSEKCGCASDLVQEGVNGFEFDPNNAEELCTRLIWFMQNENRIEEFGNQSARIIRDFDMEGTAKAMLCTFKTLNAKPGSPQHHKV